MVLNYYKSRSSVYPELIDVISSKKVVYIRKNVSKIKVPLNIGDDDETIEMYEYDEAKLTKQEYQDYLKELEVLDIRQQRADIDYIAFMTGVDLGEV